MLLCFVRIIKNIMEQSRMLRRGKGRRFFFFGESAFDDFLFLGLAGFYSQSPSPVPFFISWKFSCTHVFSRAPLPFFPQTIVNPRTQSTWLPTGLLLVLECVETAGGLSVPVKYSTTPASAQVAVGYFLTALHFASETWARNRKPFRKTII